MSTATAEKDRKRTAALPPPEQIDSDDHQATRYGSNRYSSDQVNTDLFVTNRNRDYLDVASLSQLIGTGPIGWPLALLKEVLDNSLDVCDESCASPVIEVRVGDTFLSVADNGSGLPEAVIRHAVNFNVRASSKSHIIAPTRGRHGNALKCVLTAPAVMPLEYGDKRGFTDIEAHGKRWRIRIKPTMELDQYNPIEVSQSEVKSGSNTTMHWLSRPWSTDKEELLNFTNVRREVEKFALCNPHAHLTLRGNGTQDFVEFLPTANNGFRKRSARRKSSAHWYELTDFKKLVAGTVAAHERNDSAPITVTQFVRRFDGLSATARIASVTKEANLTGVLLKDLIDPMTGPQDERIGRLLMEMKKASKPVHSKSLGTIGKDHLLLLLGGDDSFRYKKVTSEKERAIPFVIEAAFAIPNVADSRRRVAIGLNWTPLADSAFPEFTQALDENLVDEQDEVCLFVHVICPRAGIWEDSGKTRMDLDHDVAAAIKKVIAEVTRKWRKIKGRQRREDQMVGKTLDGVRQRMASQGRKRIREMYDEFTPKAYAMASGGVRKSSPRQVLYPCRRFVLAQMEVEGITGALVKDKTYTASILPKYIRDHPDETKDWDIIFDPRGNFTEPHTGRTVPLGTKNVREYIAGFTNGIPKSSEPFVVPEYLSTIGPCFRFNTVLFVEKEGFDLIIKASGITRRYDVAPMSTKGMSVTASRTLVEKLSALGVTILVLHDFDKYGFSIFHTLCHNTDRFKFAVRPNVVSIGLRLADVNLMDLESEPVTYSKQKKDPKIRLRECGATEEECKFLVRQQTDLRTWHGRRVELNAMHSDQLIAHLERMFTEHKVRKIIPPAEHLNQTFTELARLTEAKRQAEAVMWNPDLSFQPPPPDLVTRVDQLLQANSEWPWDQAVKHIVDQMAQT